MRNSIRLTAGLGAIAIASLSSAAMAAEEDTGGISDIVVTAQKREQNAQDVPISIAAFDQKALTLNRIQSVMDIGTKAPNVFITPSNGGNNEPSITIRGAFSGLTYPGADKAVSSYLDGVWLGGTLGASFELPDVERIEVLRGPQGTLFGRNSTAGAISVTTRDPAGEFGARGTVTVGNYDQLRASGRIDTPSWGPFSASFSYTHTERRGDIRNLGAGTKWDRSASPTKNPDGKAITTSPKYLGDKNQESLFLGVKFEPSDSFKAVYKYDWMKNDYTPGGTGVMIWAPENIPGLGTAINNMYLANPFPISLKRTKAVNNDYATPATQGAQGHNLTVYVDATDNLSFKNILSYRKNNLYTNSGYGFGGLKTSAEYTGLLELFGGLNPGDLSFLNGSNFQLFSSTVRGTASQWSNEFQLNYDSQYLTLTAGVLYMRVKSQFTGPKNMTQINFFSSFPGNVIPASGDVTNAAISKSLAGYAQAEVHVLPQLDLIGGIRFTNDKKATTTNKADGTITTANFSDTRPSWSLGANFKVNDDILVYAKRANAFVSGGSFAGVAFKPEVVDSFELGLKSEFFDRRVRFNLALWDAKYKDKQAQTLGRFLNPPITDVLTVIISSGDLHAKGFEADLTVAPLQGLTLNGGIGYSKYKLSNLAPQLGTLDNYRLFQRPKWTGNVSAAYDTQPLFGDSNLSFQLSGNYVGRTVTIDRFPVPAKFKPGEYMPARWIFNSRVTLQKVPLGGAAVDFSLWSLNLFNSKDAVFPAAFSLNQFDPTAHFAEMASYQPARTFGLDVTVSF